MAEVKYVNPRLFPPGFVVEMLQADEFFKTMEFDRETFSDANNHDPQKNGSVLLFPFFRLQERNFTNFKFIVWIRKTESRTGIFRCAFQPGNNPKGTSETADVFTFKEVKDFYTLWMKNIEFYNQSDEKLKRTIEDEYFENFYSQVEMTEEDREKPLTLEEQELASHALQHLLGWIQDSPTLSEEEKKPFVERITETLEKLGASTKQEIIKGISRIRAMIQTKGPKLLKELKEAAIKEGAKRIITKGADVISDVLHLLT